MRMRRQSGSIDFATWQFDWCCDDGRMRRLFAKAMRNVLIDDPPWLGLPIENTNGDPLSLELALPFSAEGAPVIYRGSLKAMAADRLEFLSKADCEYIMRFVKALRDLADKWENKAKALSVS